MTGTAVRLRSPLTSRIEDETTAGRFRRDEHHHRDEHSGDGSAKLDRRLGPCALHKTDDLGQAVSPTLVARKEGPCC